MRDIRALTMLEAKAAMEKGELTVGDVNASTEQAIEVLNPSLGAFSWLATTPDIPPAVNHPLAGFSMALKANICAREMRTDCGSRLLANHFPAYDSTVVSRLRAVGARFPGTTAMDEFGMGSSCEHSAWGPVCNPWSADHIAGGSSGGSASAVAASMAWYGLGSDTGGSVRYPAHCCGVVGLKPTYGRISRYGLVAFASSLDTIGILARDIADTAVVFKTLAGHDTRDATSTLVIETPDYPGSVPVKEMNVGVPWELLETDLQPDVMDDFKRSLQQLQSRGVHLVEVELPAVRDSVAIYTILASAEASSNLARFDGTAFGVRSPAETYSKMVQQTRSQGFGIEVKRRILMGTHVLSAGYRSHYYERALGARARIRQQLAEVLEGVHAIAMPTAAGCAFPLGSRLDDPLAMYKTDAFTIAANLAGLPALTIPTALGKEGLPLSIQFMGRPNAEELLFNLAFTVERQRAFRTLKEAPWHRPL